MVQPKHLAGESLKCLDAAMDLASLKSPSHAILSGAFFSEGEVTKNSSLAKSEGCKNQFVFYGCVKVNNYNN